MYPFFELSLGEDGSPPREFEGMSVGTFTDMWGREFTFPAEDMPQYEINTAAAILATADSEGRPVGLPIAPRGHYNDLDAAGWIVGVRLSERGDKLLFTPRWTEDGKKLIGEDRQRFFSGSIDTENKTVLGGSLTNWPATRDAGGRVLLRPVELSHGVWGFDMQAEPTSIFADILNFLKSTFGAKPAAELKQPEKETDTMPENVAELSAEQIAQLDVVIADKAKAMFEAQLAKYQREAGIAEYTRTVTGQGLPIDGEVLTAFLSSLSVDQLEQAKSLLSAITEKGVVPFRELGHSNDTSLKSLSAENKVTLRAFLAGGGTIEEFFTAAEMGDPKNFDLAEFVKE